MPVHRHVPVLSKVSKAVEVPVKETIEKVIEVPVVNQVDIPQAGRPGGWGAEVSGGRETDLRAEGIWRFGMEMWR